MTTTGDDAADRQALEWAMRVDDPGFDDWDAFSAWLAQDPGHAERYDRMEASLTRSAAMAESIPPAPPTLPANAEPAMRGNGRRGVDRRWAGGAIAAAIVGVIGFNLWSGRAQPYDVATAAGRQRTVALADGSAIILAGGSRVRLDRAAPRTAQVEAGSALFRVRHDASAPFVVRAGELEVMDVGTVFDVTRDAGVTHVAVAEGAVVIDPKGASVRLDPGQAARVADGRIERQDVLSADVGRWREGVLRFDDASLAEVAAALTRTIGRGIEVAPSLSATRFRGTVDVRRIGNDPALLGRLLDVSVRRTATGWRLEPHG